MPIPQVIRVNPLDLQGNIAIGVSLPFNGPGVFNSTYNTQDQIKSNLINLLLTSKGERIMNPEFGANLRDILFEGITEDIIETAKFLIGTNVSNFIPEITVENININTNNEANANTISISVQYRINLSGTKDQITVQFI